jgi:hypothetical protein
MACSGTALLLLTISSTNLPLTVFNDAVTSVEAIVEIKLRRTLFQYQKMLDT